MAAPRKTQDDVLTWLEARGGIAHREEAVGVFPVGLVRAVVRDGAATLIRRAWISLQSAPADLRTAAEGGGRITCTSLARRRGWWMPGHVGHELHLHVLPGSASTPVTAGDEAVGHWTKPLVPPGRSLVGSVEDALLHISTCLDRDDALVLWESAARTESIAPQTLRAFAWPRRIACELAAEVTGLSDSGLETLVVIPLMRWGIRVRQQIVLAGRPVDVLVGERLVVQIDGYEFHSSSAQRTKDIAHDAELRLRGFTVLRLSYAQIVHDWPRVERMIRQAIAAGLHRAA